MGHHLPPYLSKTELPSRKRFSVKPVLDESQGIYDTKGKQPVGMEPSRLRAG